MASRKFKESWIPTPLKQAPTPADETPAAVAQIPAPSPASPAQVASGPAPQHGTSHASGVGAGLVAAASEVSTRAAAAGHALATAASSAAVAARASAVGSALAAGSAAATARAAALGKEIVSSAGASVAAARAAAAANALASAIGPLPSPIAGLYRARFILNFYVTWALRESIHALLVVFSAGRTRSIETAIETRAFAERLGGSWITLMRLVSLRGDVLGEEFCRELAKTRDRSRPVPFDQIRQVVDEELHKVGTTFEDVFSEFDEQPLTARAFSQVHRARLKGSNREVTVRVRAPDAVQRAKTDWRYLQIMLFFIEQLDIEPHLRLSDLFFEVKRTNDDLLDFRTEVEELRRIRKVLRRRNIYIPMVFRRYCTERVLVLEYIHGVSVADVMYASQHDPQRCFDWLRENKISLKRVWRRLFNAHHELLFEHNLFYTELTPNSVILLKGNRISFVSLGSIGTLDAELQRGYRNLYRAFIVADYTKACDYYLTLGPAIPLVDITNMRQQAMRALRKWESRTHVKNCPYSAKSLGSAVGQLARCASQQKLPASWNLARLQLAESIMNQTLEFFDPTRSSLKALKAYERSAQLRAIKNAATKNVRKRADGLADAVQLNVQLMENLENDAEYLRRRLMGAQAKLSKASAIGGRLIAMVAKLALAAILLQGFLFVKNGYRLSVPLAERGTIGKILAAIHPQSRLSWILLLIVLYYSWRFLSRIAGKLFTREVSPSSVS
jgi:ubiquinone biosynthesis protein